MDDDLPAHDDHIPITERNLTLHLSYGKRKPEGERYEPHELRTFATTEPLGAWERSVLITHLVSSPEFTEFVLKAVPDELIATELGKPESHSDAVAARHLYERRSRYVLGLANAANPPTSGSDDERDLKFYRLYREAMNQITSDGASQISEPDSDPKTGDAVTKTVGELMAAEYSVNRDAVHWSAPEWKRNLKLDCDPSTIRKTKTWQAIQADLELARRSSGVADRKGQDVK